MITDISSSCNYILLRSSWNKNLFSINSEVSGSAFVPAAGDGVCELMVKIQGYLCQEHW